MTKYLCFSLACPSLVTSNKPGTIIGNSVVGKVLRVRDGFHNLKAANSRSLEVKATENAPSTKPNSIVCSQCDGNGARLCSSCNGIGVNSEDHFHGRFKAGQLCWLCRGKREILCGDCNGAGFLGGFMSTFDE